MSDSQQSFGGRIVVTLFLLPFLVVTALMMASPFVRLAGAAWTWTFEPTECVITRSVVTGVDAASDTEGGQSRFEASYRYRAGGEERTGDRVARGFEDLSNPTAARRMAELWPVGEETTCWVSSVDPGDAVLVRGDVGLDAVDLLISFLGGAVFFLPMAFGFYVLHWGASFDRLTADPRVVARGVVLALALGCFAVGGLLFLQYVWRPAALVIAARSWSPNQCEILRSDVVASDEEVREVTYGASRQQTTTQTIWGLDLEYRYVVDGRTYLGHRNRFFAHSAGRATNQAIADSLPVGAEVDCWVDPQNASSVVLDRGVGLEVLWAGIPLLFLGLGGLFVYWFRRGATAMETDPTVRRPELR